MYVRHVSRVYFYFIHLVSERIALAFGLVFVYICVLALTLSGSVMKPLMRSFYYPYYAWEIRNDFI